MTNKELNMANTSKVNVALPTATGSNVDVANRSGRYGDQFVAPIGAGRTNVCDEGSYFVVTNPTPGTGLATIATLTALADTSPFFMLINNASAGGKRVYMDYIKLLVTDAGTAGASLHYNVKIDNGVGRYTSGSALTSTPQNCNMDSSVATGCLAYGGPLVAAAATAAARLLGGGLFKVSIPVVGDNYILTFGCPASGVGQGVATIANAVLNHAPVVIGPQQSFFFHIWLPSQSAASSYEIEVGWWER